MAWAAMRADSQHLIGTVATLPAGGTQHAGALGRAFAAIVGLIHDHHWTEGDVVYAFLLERVPAFEGDAIRLENDQRRSLNRLGAIINDEPGQRG